ncbi:MAG TPA: EamA family transporter [Flavisolibacter sp.]
MKKALLQLNAAVFLWGFTGVLGRLISLNETWLVWYRLLITVITLWVLFFFFKKIKKLPASSILYIGSIGTVQALHWVCFYGSIKYANVTIALTCLSTSALLSSLLEPIVARTRFDPVEIILGLFAIAGIVVIYNTHLQFSIGIVIGLLSALLTVIVSVLNKQMIGKWEASSITLYQLTGGFVGLTLLIPALQSVLQAPHAVPQPLDWLWLVILSWVCTILTFFFYINSLKKVSAFTMNLTLTLEPIYGIALAFFIFKENKNLSNWFYLGFGLIVLAVVLHTVRILRATKAAT